VKTRLYQLTETRKFVLSLCWEAEDDREEPKIRKIAEAEVPQYTEFSKLPHHGEPLKQEPLEKHELVEALREQKEYWELQMAGEKAKEINYATGTGEERRDYSKNERYRKRVRACSIFLQVLQDSPTSDDRRIFYGEEVEVQNWNMSREGDVE